MMSTLYFVKGQATMKIVVVVVCLLLSTSLILRGAAAQSQPCSQDDATTSCTPPVPESTEPPSRSVEESEDDSVAPAVVGTLVGLMLLAILVVDIILVVVLVRCRRALKMEKMENMALPGPGPVNKNGNDESTLTSTFHNSLYEKTLMEPSVKVYPKVMPASEGEEVTLKIQPTGLPPPSITWSFQDKKIKSNPSIKVHEDGSLYLPCVKTEHAGTYHFTVSNCAGSVEGDIKLVLTSEQADGIVESNPVNVEMFGEYVANCHANNNGRFTLEFNGVPSGEHGRKVDIAQTSENMVRNRFRNVTTYDDHRIILKPVRHHDDCRHTYINASYIDGYSQKKKYIASQGPLLATITDFWRLVWQQKVQMIAMVTDTIEKGQKKCEQYWPDSGSQQYGPFLVTLTEQQVFADYIIRTMQVKGTHRSDGATMDVTQYNFTSWPDHGVPQYASAILAFHRHLIKQHGPSKGPLLIHCSAGVGRTGTLICIDIALEQAAREGVVDIAGIVSRIRKQRMKMVQTTDQYVFIHDAVLESLICGNTQIPASDLRTTVRKLNQRDKDTRKTGFEAQFQVLAQVSSKPTEVPRTTALGNPTKNRNTDFLPPDMWNVLLNGDTPGYIHASYANGYKQSKGFIIAQAPMKSTCRDFWKMVYERECGVIVMLSDLTENGEEVCHKYWSDTRSMSPQKYGEYTVTTLEEKNRDDFVQRVINVTDPKSGQVQKVTQFQLSGWTPDGLCTNMRAIIDIIEQVGGVQRRTGNKPIVIHGRDTVSRSGVFCTLMNTIECCKTEGIVDVFQVVKALRIQKPGSVLTVEQYKFVFDLMMVFLDSFKIYANFK